MIEQTITELVEKAKTDIKLLQSLKVLATKNGLYIITKNLLEIEREHFPERAELVDEAKKAHKLKIAFAMVGIGMEDKITWLVYNTTKMILEKGGDFDIADAVNITSKANEIFGE